CEESSLRTIRRLSQFHLEIAGRYQGETGRLSLRKWWPDKKGSLGTSVNDFFYCASHALRRIISEAPTVKSTVVGLRLGALPRGTCCPHSQPLHHGIFIWFNFDSYRGGQYARKNPTRAKTAVGARPTHDSDEGSSSSDSRAARLATLASDYNREERGLIPPEFYGDDVTEIDTGARRPAGPIRPQCEGGCGKTSHFGP
ncbi:hypothetical protein FOZ63_016442, partial [Perkinsus olseni]